MQGIKIQLLRRPTDETEESEVLPQKASGAEPKQTGKNFRTVKAAGVEHSAGAKHEAEDRPKEQRMNEEACSFGEDNSAQESGAVKND